MTNFLKSKKVYFLSLIIPIIILIWTYLNYKINNSFCGNPKAPTNCKSFLEYLNSFSGSFQVGLILLGFFISILSFTSIYFILNKKHKVGYTFLGILILLLIYILFIILTI